MKKSIIALMGLFTLVACSEDSYKEADKMNKTGTVENNSGGMQTNSVDPTIGYESPYESANAGNAIHHIVHNLSAFELELIPYVGLAYFDGADDGTYYHPLLPPAGIDLTLGNYPNIYNRSEYLNLIECAPMRLVGYQHLDASPLFHCPTVSPNAVFCDVVGGGGTTDEANLLQDFGKIYYYKLNVIDPVSNTVVFSDVFRLSFNSSTPGTPWNSMSINSVFLDDLYYHGTTNEIVSAFTNTQSETIFNYGGNDYAVRFFSHVDPVIFEVEQL